MRLTQEQIIDIFLSDDSTAMLAFAYGVSSSTIRAIKRQRAHTTITGQLSLFPTKPKRSNRHILPDNIVKQIYEFHGTVSALYWEFGVSKQVASNIKFGHTYKAVTQHLGPPGEIKIHSLTWDDVCTIRASNLDSSTLGSLFNVTRGTINNIRSGRTRLFK